MTVNIPHAPDHKYPPTLYHTISKRGVLGTRGVWINVRGSLILFGVWDSLCGLSYGYVEIAPDKIRGTQPQPTV